MKLRWISLVLLAVLGNFFEKINAAEQRTFNLGGANVALEDVSGEVDVFFRSMRFNRAANVWNVEVLVSNRGPRQITGPLLLSVESASNTSGLIAPDGMNGGRAFVDLSGSLGDGVLAPVELSGTRTLSLGFTTGSPTVSTKVFALAPVAGGLGVALTRSLNDVGQPLEGVEVTETGPNGTRNYLTDPRFGLVTLGQAAGPHVWKFSRTNYLPVWRQLTLTTNEVAVAPNPRLTLRSTNAVTLTALAGGQLTNSSRSITIMFSPGAFGQTSAGTLTPLTGQTLPAFLPRGWSPLQAFWLEISNEPNSPGTATLLPWGAIAVNESAALVKWEAASFEWRVQQLAAGNGTNTVTVSVPGTGAYALVVADTGTSGLAAPGQPLAASSTPLPDTAQLRASGSVGPSSSPASVIGELVTATATVTFTNLSGAMPSGTLLRCDVAEDYQLQDGTRRVTPRYETFVVGYQRPGDALPQTLTASFPLRPLLLLGSDELREARVKVDVLAPGAFSGTVIETNGGQIASQTIRVLAGSGDLARRQAAELRALDPTNFFGLPAGSNVIVAAFELGLAEVSDGRRLVPQFDSQTHNSFFVLARVLSNRGLYGLEPIERFASSSNGVLTSVEPASGERLPGITGAGQYLLLRVNDPQGLVTGTTRNASGQLAFGLAVRLNPWLTFSDSNGVYRIVSPTGSVEIAATDLGTGDTAQVNIVPGTTQTPAVANLSTVAAGPRVVSISPAANATSVPRVTPIVVTFSEPVNPGSFGANGMVLLDTNGQPVTASLSMNLRGTIATLLPVNPLAASARHTIVVSTNLADFTGRELEGPNLFTFTTESDALNRPGAELVIFEPINGAAPAFGTPGAADAESPVILVNETTGETATILSRPDGSFSNSITAGADDLISAVIVNRNGTRTVLPASRQIFRDGSVGLFNGGGVVETPTENGPMQLRVDPGTISGRTIYKLAGVPRAQVLQILRDAMPNNGEVLLGGFTVSQTGEDPTSTPHLSFPIDPAQLGLPPGARPEDAGFALTAPVETDDGQIVYAILDQMHYEDGKLVTRSFVGPELKTILSSLKSSKKLGISTLVMHALGLPTLQETILHQLLLPIMIAQGRQLGIQGRTLSQAIDSGGNPIAGTVRVEPGTVVMGSRGAVTTPSGQLRTGDLFSLSDAKGVYLLLFPVNRITGDAFVLTGTHPAFPFTLASESVTLGTLSQFQFTLTVDLTFPRVPLDITAGPDVTPPKIVTVVEPRDPLPGTNANQGAAVTVAALDDQAVATLTLAVDQTSLLSLNPGLTNPPQVKLTVIPGSQTNTARSRQVSYRLTSDRRATVRLNGSSTDAAGNIRDSSTLVLFAGDRVLPPVNTNDTSGPRVIATWPADGATGVAPGLPVTVLFSEALDRASLTNFAQWLTIGGGGKLAFARAAPDNKSATIFFSGTAGQPVTFTINNQLLDRAGNPFDQQPGVAGDQSHTWTLNLIVPTTATLNAIGSGGGVAAKGRYLFALDRTPGGANNAGAVVVYDLMSATPSAVTTISLAGPARDLALIPNYTYKLKKDGPSVTGDLLAVVGGQISAESPFQFLRIFDVTDPAAPVRIGSASISLAIATVGKVQWAPPFLLYLESGGDVTSIGVINLQSFLIGMNATPEEAAAFPDAGVEGVDLNGDGDFGDTGETVPLPQRNPAGFFGREITIVPSTDTISTTQRILDFDLDPESGLFGMTLSAGFVRAPNGDITSTALLPAYRTVATRTGFLNPASTTLPFTADPAARPKRLAIFGSVRLDGDTNVTVRNIAVVSLADIAPAKLAVIDITDPLTPKLIKTVPLTGLAIPQTLTRRADGLLALATSDDVILIDPAKLLLEAPAGGQLPFIVGVISGAGSGANSFAAETSGINAVNLGTKRTVMFSAPQFQFIAFPNHAPTAVSNLAALDHEAKLARLAAAEARAVLTRTRFFTNAPGTNAQALATPNPNTHYYVRVDALGSLGATLPLVVESLNNAGQALPPTGPFAVPVRLASPATLMALGETNAPLPVPRSLSAVRLSSSPGSPLYNVYLAGPITLTGGSLSTTQAMRIETQLGRAILKAGRLIWVGLDPTAAAIPYSPAIRSTVANSRLVPGASGFAQVDTPPLPVILVPGVAGSHLTKIGTFLDRELWPGFTDVGKIGLSLKPGEEQQIVVRDLVRVAPEPYEFPSRFSPIGCLAAPIYLPLLEFLTKNVGLREYDYLKPASGVLSFLPCVLGTSQTLGNTPEQSAAARTLAGADYAQIDKEPNLFVFPYDWRRSNVVAAAQLKEYVELVKRFHPEADQVNIVAHSMGGLVARRFILDNPGVVNKLITLGSPWLGAPKTINATETGNFLDAIQHVLVIKKETLKELIEFFPGPQELMPSEAYFTLAGSPFVDLAGDFPGSVPGVGAGALTYPQFQQVIDDVYHTNALVVPVAVSKAFHNYEKPGVGKQDDWRTDNTGVEYFHVLGIQSAPNAIGKVTAKLRISPTPDDPENLFEIKREFEVEYTPGDGTVPVFSSLRINGGLNLNAPNANIYRLVSPGPEGDKLTDHNGMLANPKLLELVGRILDGDIPPPDPPPSNAGNVSHVVRIVNADQNELVASTLGNPGLSTAPTVLGDILFGLGGKLFFSREEEIPGLVIEEVDTNTVDAVIDGDFKITAHSAGAPLKVRIDRLVDGVVQQAFIWNGLHGGLFPAPLAGPAASLKAVPAAVSFDMVATVPDDINSQPTLILDAGLTQIVPAPDAVLSGEAARDQVSPTLKFHFTNDCKDVFFFLQDNISSNVTAVFVGDGPFNIEKTAKLKIFRTNQVSVSDLRSISNRVHVTATDANGNVAVPITVDLVEVRVFLDVAETVPLEDWPEEFGVFFRSPRRYLRANDEFHVKVTGPASRPSGSFRIEVVQAGMTNGFISPLTETPVGSGTYRNVNSIEITDAVTSPLNIVEEAVLRFNVLNTNGVVIGCYEKMVDRAEFAGGGIGVFYAAVDRAVVRNGALTVNRFFDAGDGDFSDDIGTFTNNLMARFILQAGDELAGSAQADVMHISSHGAQTGELFDDAKVRATGTLTISGGAITAATVRNQGKGYTNAPTVTVIDTNTPPGSGAIITVTMSLDRVASFTIVNPGSGYSTGATLRVSSPGRSGLILNPGAANAFAANQAHWNQDMEWAVLAACSALNETNNPSGLLAWRDALDGVPRPAHGILGANFPIQRQLGSHYALFWNRLNAGDTFVQAYITGMENQGNIAQPWAYICYANYLNDSITNLAPDLMTSGTFVFDNLLDFAPDDQCDRCVETDARGGAEGQSASRNETTPRSIAPHRVRVRRIDPFAALSLPVTNRYRHLAAETVEFARPYQRDAVSSLSVAEARARAEQFVAAHLPSLAPRLAFESVAARVSRNLPKAGPVVIWTNGYVVQFALEHRGVPLWGDSVRVTISGNDIVALTASAREVVAETGETNRTMLAANEAFQRALPEVRRVLAIPGDYAARIGRLLYVSPTAEWSGSAPSPGAEDYVAAWRFEIRSSEAGEAGQAGHVIWVDPYTGVLLGVTKN